MAHFYGTLKGGQSSESTRCGTKDSGMETHCAARGGAIRCVAYVDNWGQDYIRVEKVAWQGQGEHELLYDGPIGTRDLNQEDK